MMLEQVLQHLHNWFVVQGGVRKGTFTVENGSIVLPFVKDKQYIRIVGSVFNDGLHQYPMVDLTDETFDGEVWVMAVPSSVITLSSEIEEWVKNNPESAYTSESFGGYSYSRVTSPNTGVPMGWREVFRGRLNAWRKMP